MRQIKLNANGLIVDPVRVVAGLMVILEMLLKNNLNQFVLRAMQFN